MDIENTMEVFEKLIPKNQWVSIRKVSIIFKDITLLKLFSRGNVDFYRRYYIKITFKDNKINKVRITSNKKNNLKQKVKLFNQYLNTL
jgi:hypothetical protein